jgi:hypothetical protein
MQQIADIYAATRAISDFRIAFTVKLPDNIKEDLAEADADPSAVHRVLSVMELLYARAADLPPEGRELCAGLAALCGGNNWGGLFDDNRGGRIVQAMLRDNGEKFPGLTEQLPADDPVPLKQYTLQADIGLEPEAEPVVVMPVVTEHPAEVPTPA